MKCEFAEDDNKTIWLQHVSDIFTQNNERTARALEEKQKAQVLV